MLYQWCVENNKISIPVWFDYKILVVIGRLFLSKISIPVWFDYKNRFDTFEECVNAFQFQYGSIISIF